MSTLVAAAEFDAYALQYEQALSQGLRFSGEGADYFARRRIEWTAELLLRERAHASSVLDFGCGVGLAAAVLRESFRPQTIWGYDPSTSAVARARGHFVGADATFTADPDELPAETFDLAYANGVFHHIPPAERNAALSIIRRSLKPGGWLAFWENNPWNPGTRYVMSRIPFDRDAIVLSPPEARRLLRGAGFEVSRTDAWFLFPRMLAWLRPLERLVHRLPLGGQYVVLARKPEV